MLQASLTRVRGLGKKAFEQCAGFLRISGGNCALDNTPIHPESYWVVERLVERYARTAKGGGTAITPEVLSTMGPKVWARS